MTKKPIAQRMKDSVKIAIDSVKASFGFDITAKFQDHEDNVEITIPIDFEGDTIWATQPQMAELFGVNQPVIAKHILSIYAEDELSKDATHSKMELVQSEGEREVKRSISHYNLDVVLAVGYRVSGKRATAFRKWASSVLKGYIVEGYALNGDRLNTDPSALLKLAQDVRAIRTSEKNLYSQVREVFAACAIDYDSGSAEARKFFATCQDVCHWAASEKTATDIIVERADATKPNMGLTALGNLAPKAADVTIAKNYCSPQELRKMELIAESFLLYAEAMAEQEKQVSMARLLDRFTALVGFYEYPVFEGYSRERPTRAKADKFAKEQYQMFKKSGAIAGRRA